MCIEIATYDVDNATKNYEKIIDLDLQQGVSYDRGAAYIKGGVITKTFENYLYRNNS